MHFKQISLLMVRRRVRDRIALECSIKLGCEQEFNKNKTRVCLLVCYVSCHVGSRVFLLFAGDNWSTDPIIWRLLFASAYLIFIATYPTRRSTSFNLFGSIRLNYAPSVDFFSSRSLVLPFAFYFFVSFRFVSFICCPADRRKMHNKTNKRTTHRTRVCVFFFLHCPLLLLIRVVNCKNGSDYN